LRTKASRIFGDAEQGTPTQRYIFLAIHLAYVVLASISLGKVKMGKIRSDNRWIRNGRSGQ